jgi:hypothetical protein
LDNHNKDEPLVWHARKRGEVSIGLWWGKPEGERSLGRIGVDGRVIILKRILHK